MTGGPFDVVAARLEYVDVDPPSTADAAIDLGMTAAYNLELPPIELLPGRTALGIDTDGNSLFNFLEVTLPVHFAIPGFFNWSARVVDSESQEIALAAASGFFPEGPAQLQLLFDGFAIGQNGVNGPYFVRNVIIFGQGESLSAAAVLTTDAFAASEFEGFVPTDTEAPVLSVTASPNVLWPPNHQMVEITTLVDVTDNLDPDPEVVLLGIASSEGGDALGDGHTTDDILVDPDGRIFLRAERSGTGEGRTYTLTYCAQDDAGNTATVTVEVQVPHDSSGPRH